MHQNWFESLNNLYLINFEKSHFIRIHATKELRPNFGHRHTHARARVHHILIQMCNNWIFIRSFDSFASHAIALTAVKSTIIITSSFCFPFSILHCCIKKRFFFEFFPLGNKRNVIRYAQFCPIGTHTRTHSLTVIGYFMQKQWWNLPINKWHRMYKYDIP